MLSQEQVFGDSVGHNSVRLDPLDGLTSMRTETTPRFELAEALTIIPLPRTVDPETGLVMLTDEMVLSMVRAIGVVEVRFPARSKPTARNS